jgi:hypothetical protein
MLSNLQTSADDTLLDPAGFAFSPETLSSPSQGETVVSDLFAKLGFNLESSLLHNSAVSGSLKAQLLAFAATLDGSQSQQGTAVQSTDSNGETNETNPDGIPSITKLFDLAVASLKSPNGKGPGGAGAVEPGNQSDMSNSVPQAIAAMREAAEGLEKYAAALDSSALAGKSSGPEGAGRGRTETDENPAFVAHSSPEIASNELDARQAQSDVSMRLRVLARGSADEADRLARSPVSLDANASEQRAGPDKGVQTVALKVVQFANQLREIARLQSSGRAEENVQSATLTDGRGTADTLRARVDHILNRMESMQVLAKQVPTADGTQQVINLPIKIKEKMPDRAEQQKRMFPLLSR